MTYRTPGVYVEEISVFPPSVAEVETAIPAFIGYTDKAEKNGEAIAAPTRISSLKEFEDYFGKGPVQKEDAFTINLEQWQDATTKQITKSVIKVETDDSKLSRHNLYDSMQLFYANGGGNCYIVSAGKFEADGAPKKEALIAGIDKIRAYDEPTMLVIPEAVGLSLDDNNSIISKSIEQCSQLKDRFAIVDVKHDPTKTYKENADNFRSKSPSDYLQVRYSAAYYPYLTTNINISADMDGLKIEKHLINGADAPAADSVAGKTLKQINEAKKNQLYNFLKNEAEAKLKVVLPPSPAMAGIYARVDSSRGVWKAPANVNVANVVGPVISLNDDQQGELNIDSEFGKSINVIRSFSGRGTIVWGARTMDGNSNEWRYINVRRFFNMVEESVQNSTVWAVFEPNTKNTWIMVKSMIENYLITKWQEGALAGAKPDDAFYVKVGLGVTMTADDINNGIMNVEIGMAVARPAEFIVLKFSHKMQVS
jgi:uncharacterized protein